MAFKTLKGKISAIYLFLMITMMIIGAVSIFNLYNLTASIEGLMVNNYKSIDAIGRMTESLERQDSAALYYLSIDHAKAIEIFHENTRSFWKWFAIEAANITEPGERELVENLGRDYESFVKDFSALLETANSSGTTLAVQLYTNRIFADFSKVKTGLSRINLLNEKAMFRGKDELTEKNRKSINFFLLLYSAAIIIGLMLSGYFAEKFLRPVLTLTATVKKIGAGDLNQEAVIASNDEIGELAAEFNNMTKRLLIFEKSTIGDLINEKNRSLAIVKSISDPLIVLDNDYKILLMNNACEEFFDVREDKSVNKHFLEVIRNGELFDVISARKKSGEESCKDNVLAFRSAERSFYFNIIVTAVKDSDLNSIGMVVLLYNITNFKNLEKIKTDLIHIISHEFKTPLTSIMMGTSLVQDESVGPLSPKQKEIIDTIREEGERLSGLVTSLLELSRLESGKSIFNIKPCLAIGIVQNALKPFFEQAHAKKIRIAYKIPDDLPRINADEDRLVCVLTNLLSNAMRYTPEGGEIFVKAFQSKEFVTFSVRDGGPGVSEENREKIFEKFFRVADSVDDGTAGNVGLGLSIAREIVTAHGGKIWCENSTGGGAGTSGSGAGTSGGGSVFFFTVPSYKVFLDRQS